MKQSYWPELKLGLTYDGADWIVLRDDGADGEFVAEFDTRAEAVAFIETVICTGCGKQMSAVAARYLDHADTYSSTQWHCLKCTAICEAATRKAE